MDWLRENWDIFFQPGRSESLVGNIFIGAALAGLATMDHLAEVEDFFSGKIEEVSASI